MKPLTLEEKKQLKELVKKTPEFLQIKKYNSESLKVEVSQCEKTVAHIKASYIEFNNIKNKKCSINSMTFPITIENGKPIYKKIKFGKNYISPAFLKRDDLKQAFESMASNPLVESFFKDNNFCQIEYWESRQANKWVIQLRNRKDHICYIRSSLNGEEVEVIKRLYAKNSQCS